MASTTLDTPMLTRGRGLVLSGLILTILGPSAHALEIFVLKRLEHPSYLPFIVGFGVILILLGVFRRFTFWRFVALLFSLLIAGGVALFFLQVAPAPPYEGPLVLGQSLPAFEAQRGDGSKLSNKDLRVPSLWIFFRGRW